MNSSRKQQILALLWLGSASFATVAEEPRAVGAQPPPVRQCGPLPTGPTSLLLAEPSDPDEPIRISADYLTGIGQRLELHGNVEVVRGEQRLFADEVIYAAEEDRQYARGDVRLIQPGLELQASYGSKQISGPQGEFRDVRYELVDYGARGGAELLEIESPGHVELEQASYTTCLPDKTDWLLRARRVELDREAGIGTARQVSVRFKGVPLLYTPYISFPISDERKSGFLLPSFGNTDNAGTDLRVPYYWNIAPNQDATFTPRILTRRGIQLATEYRYLHERSRGILGLEVLPDDDVFGHTRSLIGFQHFGVLSPRLSTEINFNRVSDDAYFEDLGENLRVASITNLEQRLDAHYAGSAWLGLARVQRFQPLSGTAESYQRLPQLVAQSRLPSRYRNLTYHLYGEAVRFDHADPVVRGSRLDLNPSLAFDFRTASGFVSPALSLRHTHYELEGNAQGPDSPTRTLPIASVDAGLFFEREFSSGGRGLIQTLEPRLFYLYVPFRDQSDFPVFDTIPLDFGFAQLFRQNRFSGPDRQGDANQVSLALTSRILDPGTGDERLRASMGQIYYFRDRRVTLPGELPETSDTSNLIGEAVARVGRFSSASAGLEWDPEDGRTERSTFAYRYQPTPRQVVNLAYRFRRDDLEQTDISAAWPLTTKWSGVARWNYSLEDDQTLERLLGLEYRACCWSARVIARSYVNGIGGVENTAIYLQLELAGLTSVGNRIESLLEGSILGYAAPSGVQ